MIPSTASNALRSASRRGFVTSIQQGGRNTRCSAVRFGSSSSSSSSSSSTLLKTTIIESNYTSRNNKAALLATSIGLVAASFAALQQNQQQNNKTKCETNSTQNLWGKSAATAVKETEEKFGTYWPRNILILFGPPGAGKGTHGPKIEDMLGLPALSTGDMLRAAVSAGTEVGKKAEAVMKSGGLVSDDIVVGIIRDRIKQHDCQHGFILDGFPRTLKQSIALDKMLAEEGARVTKVIELEIPDSVLEDRITGRWIHKSSGRSYHVKNVPPKSMKFGPDGKTPIPETMKDDNTGEPLMQRKDDTPTALKKRLSSYHSETVPILKHYGPDGIVRGVNANQGVDNVWTEILASLKRTA